MEYPKPLYESSGAKVCCEPVYWKHEDGWDIYKKSDCNFYGGSWIPRWFDCAIAEDLPTRKAAEEELATFHVLGICLV